MNLLIDLGNSRLKWAQQALGLWRADAATLAEKDMTALLDRVWKKIPAPQKIMLCSVTRPPILHALEEWMRAHWSMKPQVIKAQAEQLGVKNGYDKPETLGADRWAALIGARGLTVSAACVVDCGTAVTVDALSAEGEFLGGVIFPGLRLLRDSLVQGTAGIDSHDVLGNTKNFPARSTADGVAAGSLLGLTGAVERLIHEYRQTLGDAMQIFVTGGDAPQIAERLHMPVTLEPDLVLKGLARIADSL
ncbi:MAG: type III pantothenate kinase [Gammaproteobacteria bacterium]|nr:type III pantothenate kinase [Gammaproteobacteria bacterium]